MAPSSIHSCWCSGWLHKAWSKATLWPGGKVTSTSSSSIAQISFQWEYGNDADKVASDIRSAVDSLSLPANVDPRVITGSFDDIPVMMLALSWDGDADALAQQAEDVVLPNLKALPGVRDVTLTGQQANEVLEEPAWHLLILMGSSSLQQGAVWEQ